MRYALEQSIYSYYLYNRKYNFYQRQTFEEEKLGPTTNYLGHGESKPLIDTFMFLCVDSFSWIHEHPPCCCFCCFKTEVIYNRELSFIPFPHFHNADIHWLFSQPTLKLVYILIECVCKLIYLWGWAITSKLQERLKKNSSVVVCVQPLVVCCVLLRNKH